MIEPEGKLVRYIGPGKKAYRFKVVDEEEGQEEVEIPMAIFPSHLVHYLNGSYGFIGAL